MVEQSHSRKRHYHAEFVAAFDDKIVADGAAGLGDVFDAALFRALYVVVEREERV